MIRNLAKGQCFVYG